MRRKRKKRSKFNETNSNINIHSSNEDDLLLKGKKSCKIHKIGGVSYT